MTGTVKLAPDDARLLDLGVRAGAELRFVRRLNERPRRSRPPRGRTPA
jgi:hypothetical protein